jgi:hypothetical protein
MLGATIRDYVNTGSAPEELSRVTARLCQEAQLRGLSADETLTEIRAALDALLANCTLTSSDRAACVHAFYNGSHRQESE